MSKQEFLERVRAGRAQLNAAIGGLTEDQLSHEIVAGEWTAKDVLAHLAAWQGEARLAAERVARGEPCGPLVEESIDEWNRRRVEERRRLPLVDVIQEFNDAYDAVMASLARCPDDGGAEGPDWWEPAGPLWWLTEHDSEHVAAITAFRERITS
jgi:Mycothiol maleylpyruvate isomerase N-terminal domain